MKEYNVAIAGATGAVGTELIKVLEKRQFPVKNLKLLASHRSVGKKLKYMGEDLLVEELKHDSFKGIDLALFSAGGGRSKEFAKSVVDSGAVMVDNSSAFRMDPEVPLVTPEVNPEDVKWHKGIIANPNCSTIIMVVAIYPIHKISRIKRIIVSTYQAASGAGAQAMRELVDQSKDILNGQTPKKEALPHQIAFNLFLHNSDLDQETGYCQEETKMIKETQKMFHDPDIKISATTVRVGVLRAHSESINLELERKVEIPEILSALEKAPGVKLVNDWKNNYFPMPIEASDQDDVLIGRVRKDLSCENGVELFISGDQILKGAALNAVQIAELVFLKELSHTS